MGLFHPTEPERWYLVPGVSNYQISSRLRTRKVRSFHDDGATAKTWLVLGETYDTNGYRVIPCRVGKKTKQVKLHHVVAELVHGPRPGGLICRHLDDDKRNNWPDNLAYGTHADNAADAARNGRWNPVRGEDNHLAKLTELQVRAARLLFKKRIDPKLIAFAIGISPGYIEAVLNGTRWGHINDDINIMEQFLA